MESNKIKETGEEITKVGEFISKIGYLVTAFGELIAKDPEEVRKERERKVLENKSFWMGLTCSERKRLKDLCN